MKVFLDTSFLMASIHSQGMCRELLYLPSEWQLNQATQGFGVPQYPKIQYITSERILMELTRQLINQFHFPIEKTTTMVANIAELIDAGPLAEKSLFLPNCNDIDAMILADALAADCDYLLSNDANLLSHTQVEKLRIITPLCLMQHLLMGFPI